MFDVKSFSAALVKVLFMDRKLSASKAGKTFPEALIISAVGGQVKGTQDVAHIDKLDGVVFGASQMDKGSSHPNGDEAVLSERYASVLGVAQDS